MEAAITVKHLKKYYKEVKAVDDISFSVAKGELFGFLGVNGAGKSTTINMLCTLLEPTAGEAWINGCRLGEDNEDIKLLTTHYMEEAAKADHIGIMSHGHFIQYGTPFSLKEAYAKDKLYLIPGQGEEREICKILTAHGLSYTVGEERILVRIENTLSALPLLEKMKDMMQGFEVIQGTLDDVFLQVTGEIQETENSI